MESLRSNSEEKEPQQMQQEERKLHSNCMGRIKKLKSYLRRSVKRCPKIWINLIGNLTKEIMARVFQRSVLKYLEHNSKNSLPRKGLFDERARLIEDLRMKEREVKAIKEIEK
ncbi:hypothetical protein Tco_1580445 [Tanacetum coccineum]